MHVTAIIAAAGAGRRLGAPVPKQLIELDGRSLLERSVDAFDRHPGIHDLIVVLPSDLAANPPAYLRHVRKPLRIVSGGARRQDSVANAFAAVTSTTEIVLVHDAARPFVTAEVIDRTIDGAAQHGAAVAAVAATDTVKRVEANGAIPRVVETIPRDSIYLAQTPQGFRRGVLGDAVARGMEGIEATDEAALAEYAGHPVHIVQGDRRNVKITTTADLDAARASLERNATIDRVGTGYDLHRLVPGKPLILAGVEVPSDRGALGHSDADVVCHAATDAILGGASAGDIGRHFPDTDPAWQGASSIELLRRASVLVRECGFEIINVDVVVVLERPKIAPFLDRISAGLASALDVTVDCVSVKGKTNEGVDAVGRGEAIAAHAVALLRAARPRQQGTDGGS